MQTLLATIKTFTFGELSQDVQAKLVKQRQQDNDTYLEPSIITNMFESALHNHGFSDLEAYWELSYSQGDGVGFMGEIDVRKYLEHLEQHDAAKHAHLERDYSLAVRAAKQGLLCSLPVRRNNHHYTNHRTFSVDFPDTPYQTDAIIDHITPNTDEIDRDIDGLCIFLKWTLDDLSRRLERDGYNEISYLTSDKVAREELEMYTEALYLESGQPVPGYLLVGGKD